MRRIVMFTMALIAIAYMSVSETAADTPGSKSAARTGFELKSAGSRGPALPGEYEIISKVKIFPDQPGFSDVASELDLDIEGGTREYVYCFATQRQLDELSRFGIAYQIEYLDYREETAWVYALIDLGEYHTPEEVAFFLDSVATARPNITVLDTIGYSVEGRVIQALIISDNPGVEEDEPEVRITGAHHGNELISAEVSLYLVDHLTTGYGQDPSVTSLVDETEIWVIPMINPDGVHYNIRYNANGQDLNRDYLCPEADLCPAGANHANSFSEPETQAMRNIHEQNRFTVSLSMHSGAITICYVWGYDDAIHPSGYYHPAQDDDLMVDICETYASLNTTPGFYVINSCDWFGAHGDANDYAYGWRGDINCTLEISYEFAPPEDQIEQYWLDNRDAIIYYISLANTGVRGLVKDAISNEPLDAAIKVLGPGREMYTDPAIGDYHRPLMAGSYGMRYECPGYISQNIHGIEVFEGEATRLDIFLQTTEQVEITLAVVDSISRVSIPAQVHIKGISFETTYYDDGSGSDLVLPADVYYAEIYSDGYAPLLDYLDLLESGSIEVGLLQFSDVIFLDDFESGLGNWIFGGSGNQWGLFSPGYESDNCLADSPEGNYYPNANTWMESILHPDFTNFERAGLYYRIKYELETHRDMAVLEYSTDGGSNWFNLGDTLTGSSDGLWKYRYADFDYFCQEDVSSLIWGFRLCSNSSIQRDGIYFDDMYILGLAISDCVYIPGDCDHNGEPASLPDVIAMIGMYRGTVEHPYVCNCPNQGSEFAPGADPNGNCIPDELPDVVAEIGIYRGTVEPLGCPDCPGQGRMLPGGEDSPLVMPTLKSKAKNDNSRMAD